MWESRVLRRAFERLELHEGKLSRAVLRGGGGGDVTSLPDPQGSNPLGPPGPELLLRFPKTDVCHRCGFLLEFQRWADFTTSQPDPQRGLTAATKGDERWRCPG